MRRLILGLVTAVGLVVGSATAAWSQVCVTVDEARDTFSASDRTAALVLITRQFESEGEHVVAPGCPRAFTVSHVRLLDTIVVTLSGPTGTRDAVAQGSVDLLPIYSQLIRSLLTGRPVGGLGTTDRSNVTEAQARAPRIHSDSTWYAKIGYGGIYSGKTYGTPSFGFGFRAELNTYAIDVAFLNFLIGDSHSTNSGASGQSIVKLSGLYFLRPDANESAYVGAGLGYGFMNFGQSAYDYVTGGYESAFRGNGLEGGLTVGYEIARATSVRVFVQADAILPFYRAESETYGVWRGTTAPPTPTIRSRYAPALVIAVGVGR